ncbi:hypothetical protein M758_3G209300 [Ceratodon purpureus]|nr:hypothetical protein M758_3G209300 [Ceratodon purpureus]
MGSYRDALARGGPEQVSLAQQVPQMQPNPYNVPADISLACPVLCYRIGDSGSFNPYQATPGEKLPAGYGRNYHGLLMRHFSAGPQLDHSILERESQRLKETTVIASFIGKKVPQHALADWILSINQKLGFVGVSFRMDMSRGFIFLSTINVATTKMVLALTPHNTPWGICVYQEWVNNFNPDNPTGLRIPVWISLLKLPHEFKPLEGYVAASLGPVYMADSQNKHNRDPRFCVGLDLAQGWPSAIELDGLEGKSNTILVNYDQAPVRCKFCYSLRHKVADCLELKFNGAGSGLGSRRPSSGPTRNTRANSDVDMAKAPQREHGGRPAAEPPSSPNLNLACPPQQEEDDGFTVVTRRKQSSKQAPKSPRHAASASKTSNQVPRLPRQASSASIPSSHAQRSPGQAPLASQTNTKQPQPSPHPPIPPDPNIIFTTEQVVDMLDGNLGDEDCLPMTWSPGRYGRNPGAKRAANASSQPCSPVRSSATSKRLVLSDSPSSTSIQAPEEPRLCILLDTPPAEAFKKIEEFRNRSNGKMQTSSNLSLDQYSTQSLSNSSACLDTRGNLTLVPATCPSSQATSSDGELLSPIATERLTDAACPQEPGPSPVETHNLRSVKLAATFKAKRSAVTKRLEASLSSGDLAAPATLNPNPLS